MFKKTSLFVGLLSILLSLSAFSQEKRSFARIGVVIALPDEMDEWSKKLQGAQKEFFRGQSFVTGTLDGYPVVATSSGIGKVSAVSATQRLISEYGARMVFFTGISAGTNPQLEIGDIIVPTHAFQHDYGWLTDSLTLVHPGSAPNLTPGATRESHMDEIFSGWDRMNTRENQMVDAVRAALKAVVVRLESFEIDGKTQRPHAHLGGVVASGDQFVASDAKKAEVKKLGGDLVDMQSAAVVQVALKNAVPCLVIRTVSDRAGETSKLNEEKFVSSAAKNNGTIVQAILSSRDFKEYLSLTKMLDN